MGLNIQSIKISDELDQLATNCTLELVANPENPNIIGEFFLPGDTQTLTATDLRPNGVQIPVIVPFDGVQETIFTGNVEYTDDLEDANAYSYQIDLSNLPVGYPERNQISALYNSVSVLGYWSSVTSLFIINDVCAQAGLTIGRIDLPTYNICGNYEVIRKTPIQVCEELCAPFNHFQYIQYKVRCDKNGLSIICVDYRLGGEVDNLYPLENIISTKRSFSMYQPDNKIGASDVLLSGGDFYESVLQTSTGTCTKTFFQTTQNDGDTTDTTSWTETTTNVQFEVTLTAALPKDNVNQYGVGSAVVFGAPIVASDLDSNIDLLKSGQISDLKINQSFVLSTQRDEYADSGAILTETITTSTITSMVFDGGLGWSALYGGNTYVSSTPAYEKPRLVKTAEVSETTDYMKGFTLPVTKNNKFYHYTNMGVCDYTTTQTYNWAQTGWYYMGQEVQLGDIQEFTNATIEFYDKIDSRVTLPLGGITATNVGKMQTRNGAIVLPVRLQVEPYALTEEGEVLKNYAVNNAFQIECPHMDYNGLSMIYAQAVGQQFLESAQCYWEDVDVTAIFDTVPVIGESVLLTGSGGVLNHVEHTITPDAAISTFRLRRLIVPSPPDSYILSLTAPIIPITSDTTNYYS
jgi:hypothetical protein